MPGRDRCPRTPEVDGGSGRRGLHLPQLLLQPARSRRAAGPPARTAAPPAAACIWSRQLLDEVGQLARGGTGQPGALVARRRPSSPNPGTGALPAAALPVPPPSSSSVSASSRASRSVMSAIFLRSGVRVDAVLEVVGDLLLAAPGRLVDRLRHRRRDLVRVHVHLAGDVAGRAADRLDQRPPGAQEALLVGVEDATSDTSGRSRPSRSRLMPTRTSYSPIRSSRSSSTRRSVSTSECR